MDNPSRRGLRFGLAAGAARARRPPFSTPSNIPDSTQISATPIQNISVEVNPQSDSPLYNGRIPPEIRNKIFDHALTEYTKEDSASQYPQNTFYTRPNYTGKRSVSINLLLTCRRTYMETYHLPPAKKEHVFYHNEGPTVVNHRYGGRQEQRYFARMQPWQLALVTNVHLFTQMFWLEESLIDWARQPFMQGVQQLTITVRRSDWWWNERNAPLAISPKAKSVQGDGDMAREWAKEKAGEKVPWNSDYWGCAFREISGLKELVLELETVDSKVVELKEIVEKAKGWRFPMKNGTVLSSEGLEVKTTEWRSPECYWSKNFCPYCGDFESLCERNGELEKCKEKKLLKSQGKGPLCTIMALRWRLAKADERDN